MSTEGTQQVLNASKGSSGWGFDAKRRKINIYNNSIEISIASSKQIEEIAQDS